MSAPSGGEVGASRVGSSEVRRLIRSRVLPRHVAWVCVAALLCGCAAYAPAPLPTAPAEFPDPAHLTASAAEALKSDRLRPANIDLTQPLTADALALIAVVSSPELKSARAKAGVARAQAFSAGLLPDPVLTLGFDRPVAGPDTITALTSALGFDFSTLYLKGVTEADIKAAREQARLDLAWQEWQVAGQARLLAARITGLERQYALAEQAQQAAEAILQRTLKAAARGDLKSDDLDVRRIAASDASDRARTSERDLAAARLDLNKLLGLDPAIRLLVRDAPEAQSATLSAPVLFARSLATRFDLAALRSGYDSQDAKLRVAILQQYPKLDLTLTGARDTAGVQTIGPQITVNLPLWNRNRGAIAIEDATRAQLRAEYEQRLSETRAEIAALVSGIEIGLRQRAAIAAQIGPLEHTALATEAAARRGDLSKATADTARQTVTDKQIALAALDQSLAEQRVTLELAVGTLRETW
jgi:cobalt-zinc-cadmium efflux system outer membrane protein